MPDASGAERYAAALASVRGARSPRRAALAPAIAFSLPKATERGRWFMRHELVMSVWSGESQHCASMRSVICSGETFRLMLPELGVNGSLADACKDCPARGEVFAKTGTVALPDYVNGRLILAESLGRYLEAEPGRFHTFYLAVNAATARNIDDALKIFDDLADVAAILCEDGAKQEETTSQADEQ